MGRLIILARGSGPGPRAPNLQGERFVDACEQSRPPHCAPFSKLQRRDIARPRATTRLLSSSPFNIVTVVPTETIPSLRGNNQRDFINYF